MNMKRHDQLIDQWNADAAKARTEPRPELSFDGCGINGPDEYRSQIATFTDKRGPDAMKYGPLFAAAPELKKACELVAEAWRKSPRTSASPAERACLEALALCSPNPAQLARQRMKDSANPFPARQGGAT